jgi:alcohol dehydrogenase
LEDESRISNFEVRRNAVLLPERFEFFCPVKIHSGSRALEHLPFELTALNAHKPLALISEELPQTHAVAVLADAFGDSGLTLAICEGIPATFDRACIRELTRYYRDGGYDALIALGTGSIVNVAKSLNIVISGNPDDLGSLDRIEHPLSPWVLVPTAVGTGYEASRWVQLDDWRAGSAYLMPNLVVLDSRMLFSIDPRSVAAGTLAALSHAAEAISGPDKNPFSDAYACAAVQLIAGNLLPAVANCNDHQTMLALVNAATLAACAFSSVAPGLTHVLGNALSRHSDLAPGEIMGVLLPRVLEQDMKKPDFHVADLLLCLATADQYAAIPEEHRATQAIQLINELRTGLHQSPGSPMTLEQTGINPDELDQIAENCAAQSAGAYPQRDVRAILDKAWSKETGRDRP